MISFKFSKDLFLFIIEMPYTLQYVSSRKNKCAIKKLKSFFENTSVIFVQIPEVSFAQFHLEANKAMLNIIIFS
jgi:hypothetical protein